MEIEEHLDFRNNKANLDHMFTEYEQMPERQNSLKGEIKLLNHN